MMKKSNLMLWVLTFVFSASIYGQSNDHFAINAVFSPDSTADIKNVQVIDNIVYFTSDMLGFGAVEFSDSSAPNLLDTIRWYDRTAQCYSIVDSMAYIGSSAYPGGSRLHVVDMRDQANFIQTEQYQTAGYAVIHTATHDSLLTYADDSSGVYLLDITSPSNPELLSRILGNHYMDEMIFRYPYIYTREVDWYDPSIHIRAIDVTDRLNPNYISSLVYSMPDNYESALHSITLNSSYLIAGGLGGLHFIDLAESANFSEVSLFAIENNILDVEANDTLAVVLLDVPLDYPLINIYDISVLDDIVLITSYASDYDIQSISLDEVLNDSTESFSTAYRSEDALEIIAGDNERIIFIQVTNLTRPVAVERGVIGLSDYKISPAYPNPFNPTTTISYALPEISDVTLTIYDITGREVATIVHGQQPAGFHDVNWNGIDATGNLVSTGVYFARMQAGDYSKTIKMVYLK